MTIPDNVYSISNNNITSLSQNQNLRNNTNEKNERVSNEQRSENQLENYVYNTTVTFKNQRNNFDNNAQQISCSSSGSMNQDLDINSKLNEEFVIKCWKLYVTFEELDQNNHNNLNDINHHNLWKWIKSLIKIRNKIENEFNQKLNDNVLMSYITFLMKKYQIKDMKNFQIWLEKIIQNFEM